MRDFQRISSFINSYNKDDEGYLGEIYEKALADKVPVMRKETRELIKLLIMMNKPVNILEIGTAVGYSALYMSRYASCHSHITTIELDEERYNTAVANFDQLGMGMMITAIKGDASDVLKDLIQDNNCYDFVFVDAAKGQYINYYEDVMKLTKQGSVIVSDNVLQDGEILESHYLVNKRDRTIHDRMRDYLHMIKNDKRLETAILSVGDGVSVSYRIQ